MTRSRRQLLGRLPDAKVRRLLSLMMPVGLGRSWLRRHQPRMWQALRMTASAAVTFALGSDRLALRRRLRRRDSLRDPPSSSRSAAAVAPLAASRHTYARAHESRACECRKGGAVGEQPHWKGDSPVLQRNVPPCKCSPGPVPPCANPCAVRRRRQEVGRHALACNGRMRRYADLHSHRKSGIILGSG
jgi:hypothetical protein